MVLCHVVHTEDKLQEDDSYLPSAGGWVVILVACARSLLLMAPWFALLDSSYLSSSEGSR